jgi:hypothetical protein
MAESVRGRSWDAGRGARQIGLRRPCGNIVEAGAVTRTEFGRSQLEVPGYWGVARMTRPEQWILFVLGIALIVGGRDC